MWKTWKHHVLVVGVSKKKIHFRKHFVSSLKRKNWEDKLTQNIVDEFFIIAFLIIARNLCYLRDTNGESRQMRSVCTPK